MNKKPGRPKKRPPRHLGKRQLAALLEKKNLTIEDIALKLRTTSDMVRRYIQKHRL